MSYIDVVMLICTATCQQGTHLVISKTSGRIIIITTFITTLFIFIAYSANILVLLQSPSHAIRTIDDLIASPVRLGIQDARYTRFYFEKENAGLLKRVYETKIKPYGNDGWVYDTVMGVERIRTQLFAFQVETTTAYKFISQTFTDDEKCALSEITVLKVPRLTGSIARNSPYKELFRQR